jgi:hypothetical protein
VARASALWSAVLVALVALGTILQFADERHAGVGLRYTQPDNGCKALLEPSARALSDALSAPGTLLAVWAAVTGALLTLAIAAAVPRRWIVAVVVPGALATFLATIVIQGFLGVDGFGGAFVWVIVAAGACAVAAGLAAVAGVRRPHPVATPLALAASWVLTVGVVVPLIALRSTSTGESFTC